MFRRVVPAFFLIALPWLVACGGSNADQERPSLPTPDPRPAASGSDASAAAARASAPVTTSDKRPRIIFLGDSLTAGLGLDVERSYPALIQKRLDADGLEYQVVNAGVSGDTSAAGLRRLEWALADGMPRVLVVALGGNDGLRGLPPEQLQQNLATIIEKAQARGMTVILAGMEAPPNFGADYTSRFRNVYPELARKYMVTLIPFLLLGVAGNPALNQGDGIHPNERGAQIIADMVWEVLEPELAARSTAK